VLAVVNAVDLPGIVVSASATTLAAKRHDTPRGTVFGSGTNVHPVNAPAAPWHRAGWRGICTIVDRP
jgi:hypothetical protein